MQAEPGWAQLAYTQWRRHRRSYAEVAELVWLVWGDSVTPSQVADVVLERAGREILERASHTRPPGRRRTARPGEG